MTSAQDSRRAAVRGLFNFRRASEVAWANSIRTDQCIAALSAILSLVAGVGTATAAPPYNPFVVLGHDGGFVSAQYFDPAGSNHIQVVGATPGYLNAVLTIGGETSSGEITITAMPEGVTEFVGLAIHVTDSAGSSHSLSSLGDPALPDLVFDLNNSGTDGDFPITAYAYNNAPSQYANTETILSAGEAALGGQPFDLLLTATNPHQPLGQSLYWDMDFSTAINNIDGITAIGVTDIGAVAAPEPTGLMMLGILAGPALLARRRRY